MRNFVIVAAAAAAVLTAASAEARPVRPYEQWCLNISEGRGGDTYRCGFATYGQCMAARTTNGEWCMLNPALGSAPPGYYYNYYYR